MLSLWIFLYNLQVQQEPPCSQNTNFGCIGACFSEFDEDIEQAGMSRTLHNVSSYSCRDRDTVAF